MSTWARGGHERASKEEDGGVAALRMVRELGWDLEMQTWLQAHVCVMHGCRQGLQTRLQ